jgi:ClpP class serine protease
MRDVELVKQTFLSHVYDERAYALEHMHTPSRLDVLPDRESLGTGQIWIGTRAYQIGLVDEVGSNEDAIAKAASLAGISHYEVIDLLNVYLGSDQEYLGSYSNLRSDWLENGPWVRLYHLYVAPGE